MGIVKTLNGSGSDSLYVFSILMVLLMFLVHLPNKYLKNLGPILRGGRHAIQILTVTIY